MLLNQSSNASNSSCDEEALPLDSSAIGADDEEAGFGEDYPDDFLNKQTVKQTNGRVQHRNEAVSELLLNSTVKSWNCWEKDTNEEIFQRSTKV